MTLENPDGPRQEDEEAIGPRDAANEGKAGILDATIVPETELSPADPDQPHPSRYKTLKWWKDRLEVVAIVAAVFYAIVTYLQWHDLRRNFVVNERPYMVVDGIPQFLTPLTANTPIHANITFKNIGKTPSMRLFGNVKLVKFRGTYGSKEFWQFITSSFDDLSRDDSNGRKELRETGAERDIAPNAPMFGTSQNAIMLSDTELSDLQDSGTVILYYIGIVSYTDGSGADYKTELCQGYWGKDPQRWILCDRYNRIR